LIFVLSDPVNQQFSTMKKAIENVVVIGAGTMGNGIAHVFAQHGFTVSLVDISNDQLKRALETIGNNLDRMVKKEKISEQQAKETLSRITVSSDMKGEIPKSQLIIEAASENPDVKNQLFKNIDSLASANSILATNTSSISISSLAAHTARPESVVGMHFFNPVPVMSLVEVIRGYATSDETATAIMQLARDLGKVPVEVQDYPGFISNRILMPMINEAIFSLHEGVAGVEEIDTVMKLGMAHPMGPLQLADFIGLDVCLGILRVLQNGFGQSKYAPCPLLVNMVTAGRLGRKTGEGFYTYNKENKSSEVSKQFL
jgi:3-hydroxybutyryl-CoA dehydrogenase